MRANHLIVDDFPSGSGTYFIQATESTVTNDRNLVLQGYGGKVKIGGQGNAPTEMLDVEGNIKAVNGEFTGNLSVGGVLTYEDVTNVDSIGIITATGADINGDLDVDGHTNLDNVNIVGVTTIGVSNFSAYTPHTSNWATSSAINLFGNYGGGISFNDNNNNGFVQFVDSNGVNFHLKNGAVGGVTKSSIRAVKDNDCLLYTSDAADES
mgnify:FL=1